MARVSLARSVDAGVHCQRHVGEHALLLRHLRACLVDRTGRRDEHDRQCLLLAGLAFDIR
jgi:hypothetical protein